MPEELYEVYNACWGPVKTAPDYIDCCFQAEVDGEEVCGQYNPILTRTSADGSITSTVRVQIRGAVRCLRIHCSRPGFSGICGVATNP